MNDLSWLRTLPGKPLVVAEIKRRSPYGWINPFDTHDQLVVCEEVGDIISVHTDELWGGSMEHLAWVRENTDKPILAKGFHPTIAHVKRALELADYCLTVGWWPGDERCWHEVEDTAELADSMAPRCVWNARNPRTGEARWVPDPSRPAKHIANANGSRLCGRWLCQASNIRGPEDVIPGMDAILIGEGLYA